MGARGICGGVTEGGTAQDRSDKRLNSYCTSGGAVEKDNQCEGETGANGRGRSEHVSGAAFQTRGTNAGVKVTAYGRHHKALIGM